MRIIKISYCVKNICGVERKTKCPIFRLQQYGNHFARSFKMDSGNYWLLFYIKAFIVDKIANRLLSKIQQKERCLIAKRSLEFVSANSVPIRESSKLFRTTQRFNSRVNHFIELTSRVDIRFVSIKSILKRVDAASAEIFSVPFVM